MKELVSDIMQILLLIGILTWTFNVKLARMEPVTILVPDDYPTKQEGMMVDKTITLTGENRDEMILGASFSNKRSMCAHIHVDNDNVQFLTVQDHRAKRTIYIRPNGSIEGTDKIQRDGDVYTFTDNIYDEIVVERSNIVIDGNQYTLEDPWNGLVGITIDSIDNITIQHVSIKGFETGLTLNTSSYNKILECEIEGTTRYHGISLRCSSHNTIVENNIKNNTQRGIYVYHSSNNNITGNNITNNSRWGIELRDSSDHILFGNNIIYNDEGIFLDFSSNNNVSGNIITANDHHGVYLRASHSNVLRDNNMTNNARNFRIQDAFVNDVDVSNTVDGKPIYFWVNRQDTVVPLDAGYVALVKCRNITVQHLNLKNNGEGVLLAQTLNSTITKNNIVNNYVGISLDMSNTYNTISGNDVANNHWGIYLDSSSNNSLYGNHVTENVYGIRYGGASAHNKISGNDVANNHVGIWSTSSWNSVLENEISNNVHGIELYHYSNNSVYGNNITNNEEGVVLSSSSHNKLYHNNFVNNAKQVYDLSWDYTHISPSINLWNDGYPSGGNYWGDYAGVDEKSGRKQRKPGSDGIGDTPYIIDENNQDNYPLMEPWSRRPQSPIEALEELTETVESWNLDTGIERSLTTKLHATHWSLEKESQNAAVRQLTAFINQVEALKGKKLTFEQANQLISEAQRTIDLIEG